MVDLYAVRDQIFTLLLNLRNWSRGAAKVRVCRFALLMALLLSFLPAGTAQARKWYHHDAPGHWVVIDDKAPKAKPVGAGQPETLTVNNLTLNVTFEDPAGQGFNDPASGPARRNVVFNVLSYIARTLDYGGGTLDVAVSPSTNSSSGILAFGGTDFPAEGSPNGYYNGVAYDHLSTRTDPNGPLPDLYCTVNFFYDYYLGSDAPGSSQYDLATLLLHEFTHGLGVLSLSDQDGNSSQNYANPGIFTNWDHHLVTSTGAALWGDGGLFIGNPAILVGKTPGVYFGGAQAYQAFGNKFPPVYTPDSFQPESSLSHFDQNIRGGSAMEPFAMAGLSRRTYNALDKAMLQDLGWKMAPPPPVTAIRKGWALYE